MSRYHPNHLTAESLQDKVILITGEHTLTQSKPGGANGIGASLVELICQHGAYACIGDVAVAAGEKLVQDVCATSSPSPPSTHPRAIFQKTDVTNYQSILDLFDIAYKTYGHIDHVVAAAGILEVGNWFDPALTLETVRESPPTAVLEVNLLGNLYVARIAAVYLRQNRAPHADRSLTLISSVAGFKETPGVPVYQATKHGILGLMRSLRMDLPAPAHQLRVNAVCPWMTETRMVEKLREGWKQARLPINSPLDVAVIVAGLVVDATLSGKSMYVEGGRAWEIEDNLDRLEPEWLGEEPSRSLAKGQEFLAEG
ncbi:putative 3-hydroxyacyl-CoA dehydrogenase, partial [Aspergillus homomorphus CBS 101889]